nr:6234_t:CDS:2 [Entrophospora candida]CAG8436583.1 887_t:CDS:2 [Entrophospora candida]
MLAVVGGSNDVYDDVGFIAGISHLLACLLPFLLIYFVAVEELTTNAKL